MCLWALSPYLVNACQPTEKQTSPKPPILFILLHLSLSSLRFRLCTLLTVTCLSLSLAAQPLPHSPATPQVPYEVRAVWLTTLSGLDWPRRPARTASEAEKQRSELCHMLDRMQQLGINTVLFQARIRATTAYASAIEPWDGAFTGTPGRQPDYDPLRMAVDECHRRGMECHAWVVAFPICKVAVAKQLGKRALPSRRPELCQKCGDQWMMDPGVPGTADYLADICAEIAQNYAVDGIHLDYIRYPEPGIPFNDNRTYQRYGLGRNKAAWRTDNVNRCVKAIHDAVKAVRPWIKISCSPVGKYADLSRYSSFGWNARDAVHQDAQRWLREGWMDMLLPMMYFDGIHYYPFLADWKEHDAGRPVVPGLGIYFLNPREKDWPLLTVQRQMQVARSLALGGQAFFRARFLLDNEKGLYDWLRTDFYATPALVPPMTWADSVPPAAPRVRQHMEGMRLHLDWEAVADETPVSYNVYRIDPNFGDVLLATRLHATHFDTLLGLPALKYSRYVVTAVDAYGNESIP